MFKFIKYSFYALSSIALLTSQGLAQSSDPAWLDEATGQLAFEQDCEVSYFITMKESELAGRIFYEARAQCQDGRQFDVVRKGDMEPFKISKCEQTVVC